MKLIQDWEFAELVQLENEESQESKVMIENSLSGQSEPTGSGREWS